MTEEKKEKKKFFYCEKCGKKLIQRLPNGMWRFIFGKSGDGTDSPPVDIEIYGSLRMKCLRRGCNHRNVLTYFPFPNKMEKF